MSGQYTVCAAFINNRISGLVQIGVKSDVIYDILKMTPEDLLDPEKKIPIETLVNLERAAPVLTQCPHIAFKIAKECKSRGDSKTGIVGQIASSCKIVGDAFRSAVRYSQLMSDAVYMEVKENMNDAEFICTRKNPDIYTLFESETAMIDSYKILRQFGDVYEIHFSHARPLYSTHYDEVFNCKVQFDSTVSKIVFEKKTLTMENPFAQPYLNHVMREYADRLMENMRSSNNSSFRNKVQSLISENLSRGTVSIDFISERLNMHRQSLYRKLKEEQITFSSVLDTVRKELATNYILSNEHSLTEIAFLLGFSEPSAFNRAYRRWFQKSPTKNGAISSK